MSVLFMEKWSTVVDAGHSKHLYTYRVKPGEVLHGRVCFCYAPEREINDIITLGILRGQEKYIVRSRGGAAAKEGMSTIQDFFVGEGSKIFAHFPDADIGDTIELHVFGVMLPIKDWLKTVS